MLMFKKLVATMALVTVTQFGQAVAELPVRPLPDPYTADQCAEAKDCNHCVIGNCDYDGSKCTGPSATPAKGVYLLKKIQQCGDPLQICQSEDADSHFVATYKNDINGLVSVFSAKSIPWGYVCYVRLNYYNKNRKLEATAGEATSTSNTYQIDTEDSHAIQFNPIDQTGERTEFFMMSNKYLMANKDGQLQLQEDYFGDDAIRNKMAKDGMIVTEPGSQELNLAFINLKPNRDLTGFEFQHEGIIEITKMSPTAMRRFNNWAFVTGKIETVFMMLVFAGMGTFFWYIILTENSRADLWQAFIDLFDNLGQSKPLIKKPSTQASYRNLKEENDLELK